MRPMSSWDAGVLGRLRNAGVVRKLLEEADVLHDAVGQEMIVLHHGLDLAAIGALAHPGSMMPSTSTAPSVGSSSPTMILTNVVLPQPERPPTWALR
jgi:hypothetical protein